MRRIHEMQGRMFSECTCGDESTRSCATCNGKFCKDCYIDHECMDKEKPKIIKFIKPNDKKPAS